MSGQGLGVLNELEVNVKDKTIHFLEDTDTSIIQKDDGEISKNEQDSRKAFVTDVSQLKQNNTCVTTEQDILNIESMQEKQKKVNYNTEQNDEKVTQESTSFLKENGEHVICLNVEKPENIKINSSSPSLNPEVNYETEIHLEESAQEMVPLATEEVPREEVQESGSPCQSDCSRATRWEALADMAAELPPSLTVDPITGHIYTVSK